MSASHVRSSNAKTKPKMDFASWQFVNITESRQAKDSELRKIVRVNAMRHYRRGVKQESGHPLKTKSKLKSQYEGQPHKPVHAALSKPAQSEGVCLPIATDCCQLSMGPGKVPIRSQATFTAAIPSAPAEIEIEPVNETDASANEFRRDKSVVALSRTSASPLMLGSGNKDPFDSYPIKGCPKHAELLNHFGNVMARKYIPIDRGSGIDENPLRTVWIPLIMTDPLLFQATTNYAAVHLDLLQGRFNHPKTLMKKAETISMINRKLQCPEEATTNSLIGSIAMMAAMERLNGNIDELRIHMDALSNIVALRGGLQCLGWKGVLQMFISWEDLLSSCMLDSQPLFATQPCCAMIDDTFVFPHILPNHDDWRGLSRKFLEIVYDIRYLTQKKFHSLSAPSSTTDIEMMEFGRLRSSIESRLQTVPIIHDESNKLPCPDYVYEEHRLAALIYVKLVLHTEFLGRGCMRALKSRLITTIQHAEGHLPGLKQRPRSVIWVLFIGGLLAMDNREEIWFAVRIVRSMKASNLETWEDVEATLSHLAWTDGLRTPVCMSLWQRVQAIRSSGMADHIPVFAPQYAADTRIEDNAVDSMFVVRTNGLMKETPYMGMVPLALTIANSTPT